jgi:isoquinoline 1-oxidoreductase
MTSHHDELLPFFDLEPPTEVSRRRFLRLFGGGIVVAVSARDLLALEQGPPRLSLARELPADFNAFLRIGEDGRVTCFTGKVEMGQGVITSLAQTLADELEVPLDAVDMVMGDTDLCPWDMGTFGSMTTRFFGPPLRAAAAEAREVLLDLAAEQMEIPRERVAAKGGRVVDTADPARSISTHELAKGQVIGRRLGRKAALEPVADFEVVGRPVRAATPRSRSPAALQYAGDLRRDGMLYCPAAAAARARAASGGRRVSAVAGVEGRRWCVMATWWLSCTRPRTAPSRRSVR